QGWSTRSRRLLGVRPSGRISVRQSEDAVARLAPRAPLARGARLRRVRWEQESAGELRVGGDYRRYAIPDDVIAIPLACGGRRRVVRVRVAR
ncbi:unnamed protein product, partial [Ectocarpus sp. 12 AP-2014]